MPYATPLQVQSVLVRDPTVVAGTAAELDEYALSGHIATAQETVDVYLTQRYDVPFLDGQIPGLVVDITVAIAAWLATLAYRQTVDVGPSEPVTQRNAWAMGLLVALGKGTADLPGASSTTAEPERAPSGQPINAYAGTLFSADDVGLGYRERTYLPPPYGWM